jgi:hypothetical protein
MRFKWEGTSRFRRAYAVLGAAMLTISMAVPLGFGTTTASAQTPGSNLGGLSSSDGYTTTADLAPGSITHVWLIILENKSYNSEFSGVNDDTFLWQTLPSEGVLLKNYYGTGHTSMDNYITLASGQAPQNDTQNDCSSVDSTFSSDTGIAAGSTGGIVNSGSTVGGDSDWTYGQAVSNLGPDSAIGTTAANTNGCTYPTDVATLFDQFNLSGVTWKGYAQDLGGAQQIGSSSFQANTVPGRDDVTACGAPGNPDETAEDPASNPTYLSGKEGYPVASNLVSSTATSGTTTSLTDTSQTWTTNQYDGDEVIITGGTGAGEFGTISANTNDTLTVTFSTVPGASAPVAPDSTSTYVIGVQDTNSYTSASLVAGSGTGPDGQSYSANNPEYSDQYVAKHFPFGWFESLTGIGSANGQPLTAPANGGTNCDANHIANLDSPSNGLVHDLMDNTVPNFSWITPDNCSDGHDSSCKGNNLSGAFGLNSDGTINLNDPIYTPSTSAGANCTPNCSAIPSYDPEATTPRDYTGGTYSADLFLAYYVPLIERSTAYQHGLIDITFDEGEPSFTYGGNTFNNIATTGPTGGYNQPTSGTGTKGPSGAGVEDNGSTPVDYPSSPSLAPNDTLTYGAAGTSAPGADSPYGADDIFADSAGESFYTPASGSNPATVTSESGEPTGPNSPLATDANGNQLDPGPGFNLDIDRPAPCASGVATGTNGCVSGLFLGDGGTTSSATRTDSSGVTNSGSSVTDNSVQATDTGREIVTATVGGTSVSAGTSAYDSDFDVNGAALPSGDAVYVGDVTNSGPLLAANSGGAVTSGSFQLIDDNGNQVTPTGALTSVTLSGECQPASSSGLASTCTGSETPDPLFDATDPTSGGGDTGSVLISPYITPGSVSTVDYNHYSWLRTMEDLFDVGSCTNTSSDITLTAGTVCGGLDGSGHLGYAAQTDLADFGSDVFTAPAGNGFQQLQPPPSTPEAPLTVAVPLAGLAILGGYILHRRRRPGGAAS